jgi:hypothetical protein
LIGLSIASRADGGRIEILVIATAIADIVWWWVCLGIGIWSRTMPGVGRGVAIALVPVVAIAAVFIGALAGSFCVMGILH